MRTRRVLLASAGASVALLAGLLTGCSQANSSSAASSETQSPDEYNIKLAQCLRDAGFDVPDPNTNGGQGSDIGGDPASLNEALAKCEEKLGPAPGAEQAQKELNDPASLEQSAKAAECLRNMGYDVPDPVAGQGLTIPDVPADALQQCFEQAGSASLQGGER